MRIVVAAITVVLMASAAFAERRVALVMGADRYEIIRPLANAVNDARAIEKALDALGFEVIFESNRDLRRMRRALQDFAEDAAGADVAFVFFAGHGVEIGGENRLLLIDADASSLEALKASSLPLEELRSAAAKVADIALIVLDACRNDPFAVSSDPQGRGASALRLPATVKPGLGRLGRSENTLIAFAAAPGETASDGEGQNSPFTTALTKYLGTDGLEIRSVLTLVQQEVYDKSRGAQLPYVESGLPALFFASQTSGDLPERERLLLAMADVSPQMREDVERIASNAGMPLAPLFGALIGGNTSSLNREERTEKLREAAAAFTKVRDELRTLRSGDERVTALRRAAEEQLVLGAFDAARAKLTEAAGIDANSRETLKANLVERTLSEAATHYLNGGAAVAELKYQFAIADYEKAVTLYEDVEDEDKSEDDIFWHFSTLNDLRETYRSVGSLPNAADAAEKMLTLSKRLAAAYPEETAWQNNLSFSHDKIGDVRRSQGNLAAALAAFEAAGAIRKRLHASDPDNADWQSDLAFSEELIGNIRLSQDDIAGAQAAYEASLNLRQRLLSGDPDNLKEQFNLAISHDLIGDIRMAKGDQTGALVSYEAGLAVRKRLDASDPTNLELQRSLSISFERIGDAFFQKEKYEDALNNYVKSLDIRKKRAREDPENVGTLHDFNKALLRVGDSLKILDYRAAGLAAFVASHLIRENLAAIDPTNARWEYELIISHMRLAEPFGGDDVSHYRKALEIAQAMKDEGRLEPAHEYQIPNLKSRLGLALRMRESDRERLGEDFQLPSEERDLAFSYESLAEVEQSRGLEDALVAAYEVSVRIAQRRAADAPENVQRMRDLAKSHERIGLLHEKKGDVAAALLAYETALVITRQLADSDPRNSDLQQELVGNFGLIGYLRREMGDLAGTLSAYKAAHTVIERFVAANPSNISWQRFLLQSHTWIVEVGGNPETHYHQALEVATALKSRGGLGPSEEAILDELRAKLDEP